MLETPILDERKWAKIPSIPVDAVLLDLEDSVAPERKLEARSLVVDQILDPRHLGGRLGIARPNHLATQWGNDDLMALGRAGVKCIAYPKIERVADLLDAREVLRTNGADPDIFAIIETAGAVLDVAAIASTERVVALMFGAGDLSVDADIALFDQSGELNGAFDVPKMHTVLAGAANDLLTVDMPYFPDFKDLAEVHRRYARARQLGFKAGVTFYPPHVEVINNVFGPSAVEIDEARRMVVDYEALVAAGRAASMDRGRTVLIHDYEKALRLLSRAQPPRTTP